MNVECCYKATVKLVLLSFSFLWFAFTWGSVVSASNGIFNLFLILHICLWCFSLLVAFYFFIIQFKTVKARLFYFIFFILISIFFFLFTLTPPVNIDALVHHLFVPKWWLEHNNIQPITWHSWSYYPPLIHLGYLALFKLNISYFSSFYHFTFVLLTTLIFFLGLKKIRSAIYSVAFSFSLLLMPIFLKISSQILVDNAVLLFSAIALLEFLFYLEKANNSKVVLGTALGLSMFSKYNGFLFAVFLFLGLIMSFSYCKYSYKEKISYISLNIVVALFVISPFLMRNFIVQGNPVYPLFNSYFNKDKNRSINIVKSVSPIKKRIILYREDFKDIVLLPWRVITEGKDYIPQNFDGKLSLLLLLSFLSIFFLKARPYLFSLLIIYLGYLYFATFFTTLRIRYLVPIVPILLFLSLDVLLLFKAVLKKRVKFYSLLFYLWTGVFIFNAFFYCNTLAKARNLFSYIRGKYSQDEYISLYIKEYPLIQYVNNRLSVNDKVYLIFTSNAFYYYNIPVVSNYFSANKLISIIIKSNQPSDIRYQLAREGITYILVNQRRLRYVLDSYLTLKKKQLWNKFINNHLLLVKAEGEFLLWKII